MDDQSVSPLYVRLLGRTFDTLPAPVRAIHDVTGRATAVGRATVRHGPSPIARLVAAIMRFPPPGDHELTLLMDGRNGVEHWTRDFGGHRFSSVLGEKAGRLTERVGPFLFSFDLSASTDGLAMAMRGWSAFGLPMPMVLAPHSDVREWADGEDYCFDVSVGLPGLGLIVRYSGRLRRS